jgi:GNAT superfamily N-acetyltransferase
MDRFAELWAETMPADAEPIYAELGLTADEVAQLPHEIGELRTVEEDGATAGDVWLELRGPALHVHALLLEPRFRGRGIGGRVLSELEDEFPGRIDQIELGVEPGNTGAAALRAGRLRARGRAARLPDHAEAPVEPASAAVIASASQTGTRVGRNVTASTQACSV